MLHQKYHPIHSDRGIHQIPGLDESTMRDFMARLLKSKKTRARRSILRECRLWFKRNVRVEVTKAHIPATLISFQDGMSN